MFMSIFELWLWFLSRVEGELVESPEGVIVVDVDVHLKALIVDSRDGPRYEEDNGVEVSSGTEGMEVVEEKLSTIGWKGVPTVKG